jgi:hypothetical protein
MTALTTRQDIATALTSVTGIFPVKYMPEIVTTGDAWPRFISADRAHGDAFEYTWAVNIVLGSDPQEAETAIDRLMPLIVDALDPVAFIDSYAPGVSTIGGTDVYVLEIRCRRE